MRGETLVEAPQRRPGRRPRDAGVNHSSNAERARGDRRAVDPARKRAERAAVRRAEPARAERVGNGWWSVADQQGGLECEREVLDRAAGEPLRVVTRDLAQRRRERVEVRVEPRIAAAALPALGEERRQPVGLARQRAQHVERDHVAGSLPDPVQRRVAQQPGHRRLLDVAVAAEALERLGRVRRRALADPVLHHGGAEAPQRPVVLVVCAREAQRRRGRGLRLEREVGEHVEHQRLLGQARAERAAVAGVVDRLGDAAAHPARAADDAVEPRVRDHLDDRRDAAALFPEQPRLGAAELDLAGRERARAELVLQALDLEPRAALDDEAGEPARSLREDEEDVADRMRAEPLVAGQLEHAVAGRFGASRAGADVGAALLLRHRHAAERAALVVGQRQPRLPLGRDLRLRAERGDGGVGHRDRAHDAGVGLRPQQLQRRARDVRARARLTPWERVDLALYGAAQQPVPARVVVDAIDAVPVAVVGLQPRRVALGAAAMLLRLGGARDCAAVAHAVDRPAGALALEPFAQRGVGIEVVDVLERRRLVEDLVRAAVGERHRRDDTVAAMESWPLVLSGGWAAGVNAYATVLLLGIFGRLGLGEVPDGLERPEVMIAAGVLYAVEFVTDKIPYVDHVWDAIHTAIPPTIAAVIGLLLNDQADGLSDALAAVGSSTTALASHGVKAGLRMAVNVSPDPFTTATASLTEDFLVGAVVALIVTHPWIALGVSMTLLAIGITLVVLLWRRVRAALAGQRAGPTQARSAGS